MAEDSDRDFCLLIKGSLSLWQVFAATYLFCRNIYVRVLVLSVGVNPLISSADLSYCGSFTCSTPAVSRTV